MKFIKSGVIYDTHNEFVIMQMTKAGMQVYEDAKTTKEEKAVQDTKEPTKEKKKKK